MRSFRVAAFFVLCTGAGCGELLFGPAEQYHLRDGTGGSAGAGGASEASSSSSGSMAECTVDTVDADCPDPGNECEVRTCDAGKCGTAPVALGTPVAAQTAGDCQASVCDGNGATIKQNDDADKPNDGKECTDDTCVAGAPTFTPKALNAACGAGGALFCDAVGACVGCTDATQCGTASDCATPVCNAGSCGTNFTAVGTATTNQTMGDCQEQQCDGIGGTKVVVSSTDALSDNNPCTADSCNGSTPKYTNLPAGALCSNGTNGTQCNGAGACVQCLLGSDCTSGVCVAQACAAPTCTDTVKNDVETDVDCGGGVCPTCANTKACNSNADCTSTVCSPGKTCVASICGDSKITGAETCDDGNTMAGDGCSATCTIQAGYECTGVPSVCTASCGDGTLDAGETCDDGGTTSGNGCSATCTIQAGYECTGVPSVCTASCGDGTLDAGETCDDGGTTSGNGCSATCTIEAGYECTGVPSVCTVSCGDGTLDPGETCDDSNKASGDGCSSTCAIEPGYVCSGTPSVCVASCGNGVLNGTEGCDDNNLTSGDGCSSTCAVEPGYACAGAPSVCATVCGDGIRAGTEACDDMNLTAGDCCSATCTVEAGCEIEPNNTSGTANSKTAVFLSNVVKAFIKPSADVDYFSIVVPTGGAGKLDVSSGNGPLGSTCASLNVDTNVTIYDSLGNTLGVNDDISASDYCSTLSVPGLPPGTYYIEVKSSPFVPDATFDYSLQATVTSTPCGNGVLNAGEACDDGNTVNKDGCSTLCALEPGFTCAGTPTVCVDKNECMLGTANCAALATCANTPGSFNCVCPANLDGDGKQNGVGCTTGIYYAFDGSGTAVPNLATTPPVNNAANATIVGGQTQGGVGKCGTALVGIGGISSANYVNTAWPTILNSSWTISFWINNYTSAVSNDYFFGDSTAQSFRCLGGGFAGATNVVLRGTGMSDVIVNGAANGSLAMTTFVYDATANNIKAYLNGALVNTVAQAGPLSFVGTGPLKVGGYATVNALPANARLDEFRLYFRPFTAAQVAALYNSASCTPNGGMCAANTECASGMCYAGTCVASINGCNIATATDLTAGMTGTVTFANGNFTYAPKCIKMKAGATTVVTFNGNFGGHPLQGGEVLGGVPTPSAVGPFATVTNSGTSKAFTMTTTGTFPYYCVPHGTIGMNGAVFVVP